MDGTKSSSLMMEKSQKAGSRKGSKILGAVREREMGTEEKATLCD